MKNASQPLAVQNRQPPAKAGGFQLRTESPNTRLLNDDASCSPRPLVGEGLGERAGEEGQVKRVIESYATLSPALSRQRERELKPGLIFK